MMTPLKARIEAILFLTGKALQIQDIAEKLGEDPELVEEALLELMSDYSFREDSALEIDDGEGYILQVRDGYSDVVNKMVPVELSAASLRTLSAIALHAPIKQSMLIEVRGANAYDHVKDLLRHKLISKRRNKDRFFILDVTPKFYEYFKFTGDKAELKALMSQLGNLQEVEEPSVNDLPQSLPESQESLMESGLSDTD